MGKPVNGIKCNLHGNTFHSSTATRHLHGNCCEDCSKTGKKTTESFVAQCREKYEEFFDYSETVYSGVKTKLSVKCRKCGK